MLYLAGIAVGLLAGFAARGRLANLAGSVRLRAVWLLYAALAAQLAIGFVDSPWLTFDRSFAILLLSYAVLVTWLGVAAATHRAGVRWMFAVVAVGTGLNFVAIAANRGMPVSRHALEVAGAPIPSDDANRFAVKHVLAGPGTVLNPLGDVIPVPGLRDVISVGDILIGVGIAGVIVAGMRARPEADLEAAAPGGRAAAAGADPPPPEGARSLEPLRPILAPAVVAVRGGVLDRETTVGDFVSRFAAAYSVGKSYEPMSEIARHPSESRVVLSQAMGITDANLAGNVHGGVIMKLVDTAAGLSAIKHAHGRVVTVAMDEMSFLEPVFLTDVVTLYAQVNDVGRTSMEVGVRVEAENTITGERRHVSSAYLVFVALDEDGKPRSVPRLEPETDEERRRSEDAKIRRRHRIARKQALLQRRGAQGEPVSSTAVATTPESTPVTPSEPFPAPISPPPGSSL